jgi:hypothetical protein
LIFTRKKIYVRSKKKAFDIYRSAPFAGKAEIIDAAFSQNRYSGAYLLTNAIVGLIPRAARLTERV